MANSTITAITFFEKITEPIYSKIVVAMVLLVVGLILGKFAGKAVKRLLSQIQFNKLIRKAIGINLKLEEILSSIVTYIIYFIFTVWALESIGISTLILNFIAVGAIIIIVLSVLLGIKDFIPNLIAGLVIHRKDMLHADDRIRTGNIDGKVISVDLLSTRIETEQNDIIFIPNSLLIREKFVKKKGRTKPKK